jgi:hypothetical protein
VKILTNNPARKSNNWGRLIPGQARSLNGLRRRGVRRLMKVDPTTAQGTPDSQLLVAEPGVVGKSGASSPTIMGRTESKRTGFGGGKKVIRSDGVNRSLKKR